MTETTINTITPLTLAETLQNAGYRALLVEQNGLPQINSATQGIGFSAIFGNLAQGKNSSDKNNEYFDFIFTCSALIGQDVPPDLIASWNRTRRFSRLWAQPPYLVLAMDVSIAGGVRPEHLRSQIELWDRLIHELVLYLRSAAAPAGGSDGLV